MPLLSKLRNVQEMCKLLWFKNVRRSPVRCVTAEGPSAPNFGLLRTVNNLDDALAEVAGSQCLAPGIKMCGDTFLAADANWVLIRGCPLLHLNGMLGRSTQRLQRSHIQRDVRRLVVAMLKGMCSGGESHISFSWRLTGAAMFAWSRVSWLMETCRSSHM